MSAPTAEAITTMAAGNPAPAAAPTSREIREWAREHGWTVSDRGRIPAEVRRAFEARA